MIAPVRPDSSRATGSRHRRTSAVVIALLIAAGGLGECSQSALQPGVATSLGETAPPLPASGPADAQAQQWSAARQGAVRRTLAAQARAVVAGDVESALAAVAPGAAQTKQRPRIQRMVQIGLSELTVSSVVETVPPVPVATGVVATWDVEAAFDYRIKGFDRSARRFTLALTFSGSPARPDRVLVVDSRPADRPQPWDLGDLEIRRSSHSLVIATGKTIDPDEALRRADRAAARVAAVWGRSTPAVWLAPARTGDAERLLGRSGGELIGIAAATDGPLEAGTPAGADRIVLSPEAWASLRPVGRDVVMAHELTHVTVRASTTREVPLWLSEGFAEYVAYRSRGLSERTVAAPLVPVLRDGGVPGDLPDAARFGPGTGTVGAAYAEAWLAVLVLVERHGEHDVVAFYRAAAGGLATPTADLGDADAVVDLALHRVLATTRADVVAAWRQRLAVLARE